MNKTLQTLLIVAAVLVIAGGLVGAGFFIGRTAWGRSSFYPNGMIGFFNHNDRESQFGYGMMGSGMMGDNSGYGMMDPGMMNSYGHNQYDGNQFSYGNGMMGGNGGYGMMGGFGTSTNADPLSAQESLEAVEAYLTTLSNDDLVVAEIMVFDNNSYAIVKEESTGIGAFELLVDPATKVVFPEYGPNMMWNLKYGMHAGSGFGGGMMGPGMMGGYGMMGPGMMSGYMMGNDAADSGMMNDNSSNGDMKDEGSSEGDMMGDTSEGDMMDDNSNNDVDANSGVLPEISAEMNVSEEEALEYAQNYLDTIEPGVTVSHEITAFYGYYTVDLEKDSEIVGMLSVHGFSGQVFPHTWHGDFIEMIEFDHE